MRACLKRGKELAHFSLHDSVKRCNLAWLSNSMVASCGCRVANSRSWPHVQSQLIIHASAWLATAKSQERAVWMYRLPCLNSALSIILPSISGFNSNLPVLAGICGHLGTFLFSILRTAWIDKRRRFTSQAGCPCWSWTAPRYAIDTLAGFV